MYGIGKTLTERTLHIIREQPFSQHIDESTSNNHKRILAVIVRYFDDEFGGVVQEHLASVEVIKVDTTSLLKKLTAI